MAIETHFRLLTLEADGICPDMDPMTTGATSVVELMRAALPCKVDISTVAIHAHGVLFSRRRECSRAEIYHWRMLRPRLTPVGMLAARPMAGLALRLRHRGGRIDLLTMRSSEDNLHRRIVVAIQAGFRVRLCGGRLFLNPRNRWLGGPGTGRYKTRKNNARPYPEAHNALA